jgi:hypothetical protein
MQNAIVKHDTLIFYLTTTGHLIYTVGQLTGKGKAPEETPTKINLNEVAFSPFAHFSVRLFGHLTVMPFP